jgi:carboxyl-terminal processing protease
LVQQQYSLVDSSKIRVTISRYYTPSGRLIQKPYENKTRREYAYENFKREDNAAVDVRKFIKQVPDSLKYKTDAGRTVYGGGGIIPDHVIQEDTTQSAAIYNFMRRKRLGFDFVQNFLTENGEEFKAKWNNQFDRYLDEFTWNEKQTNNFHQKLLSHGLVETDTVDTAKYENDTLYVSENAWDKSKWMSMGYMKADLARQVWGLEKYYQVFNHELDQTLDKAMRLWDEVRKLHKMATTSQDSADPSPSKAYN